jgi:hypothetical protein
MLYLNCFWLFFELGSVNFVCFWDGIDLKEVKIAIVEEK